MRRLGGPILHFIRSVSSTSNPFRSRVWSCPDHGLQGGHGEAWSRGWWMAVQRRLITTEGQLPISQDMLTIVERGMLAIERHHARLNQALSEHPDEMVRLSKELSKLEDFMDCIASLRTKRKEMEGLKTLVDDPAEDDEMRCTAAVELRSISREEMGDLHRMLALMLPQDEAEAEVASSRSEPAQEERKHDCLPWTFSECMKGLHKGSLGGSQF